MNDVVLEQDFTYIPIFHDSLLEGAGRGNPLMLGNFGLTVPLFVLPSHSEYHDLFGKLYGRPCLIRWLYRTLLPARYERLWASFRDCRDRLRQEYMTALLEAPAVEEEG